MRMSLLPRWVHRAYAWVGGYGWRDCPLCGRCFGGHEWKEHNGLSASITTEVRKTGRTGRGICPACTREGRGDPYWAPECST